MLNDNSKFGGVILIYLFQETNSYDKEHFDRITINYSTGL